MVWFCWFFVFANAFTWPLLTALRGIIPLCETLEQLRGSGSVTRVSIDTAVDGKRVRLLFWVNCPS